MRNNWPTVRPGAENPDTGPDGGAARGDWSPHGIARRCTRESWLRLRSSTAATVRVVATHNLHRKIAGAEIRIIDGAGHDLAPQLAAEFAQLIIRVACDGGVEIGAG